MDRVSLVRILNQIGAQNILDYGQNVQCSCFLAKWRRGHSSDSDHAGSMGISTRPNEHSLVHCFSCGFGGTFEQAVATLHQYGDVDLTNILREIQEIEELDPEWLANSIPNYDEDISENSERIIDEKLIQPMMGIAHKYILDRKITIETLRAWEGGYDRLKRRVVFPVRRRDGALVGMVGRRVREHQKPKYFNYFEFDKGEYLFGEHLIGGKTLVVAEGLLDAPSVWQALNEKGKLTEYSVVSPMGAKVSPKQIEKIVKYADDIVLFFDNDSAGWEGQRKVCKKLQKQLVVRAIKYPTPVGEDASSLLEKGVDIVALIEDSDLYLVT